MITKLPSSESSLLKTEMPSGRHSNDINQTKEPVRYMPDLSDDYVTTFPLSAKAPGQRRLRLLSASTNNAFNWGSETAHSHTKPLQSSGTACEQRSTLKTEENNTESKDLAESAFMSMANTPPLAVAIRQQGIWKRLNDQFYPPLGATPAEEKAAFITSLDKVTRGLEGDEKYKAVLVHMQERITETGFSYGYDIDTEGLRDYASPVSEILEDRGQGIDCEDFSIILRFWGRAALAEGYLPEGSQFHFGKTNTHAFCIYESPEGDKYILDGTFYVNDQSPFANQLLTLSEYREINSRLDTLSPELIEINEGNEGRYWYYNGTIVTDEWMHQSSDSPIDQSISDFALKEKIYGHYGVAPDPMDDKGFLGPLWEDSNGKFWLDKFDDLVESPLNWGSDSTAAVAEGTAATAFAAYKMHKLLRRRHNCTIIWDVQQRWAKKPESPPSALMEFGEFKDFRKISPLVDNRYQSNKKLKITAEILGCHKNHLDWQTFKKLLNNLYQLFPEDHCLTALSKRITPEKLKNQYFIKQQLEKRLQHYGISIRYVTNGTIKQKMADKFRQGRNKELVAYLHQTVIDKKKLYKKLKSSQQLLPPSVIKRIINDTHNEIKTLYGLRHYDKHKLRFIRSDLVKKVGAAVMGIIPLIPVDECFRVWAYASEANFRTRNNKKMNIRITNSLRILNEKNYIFGNEDYQRLSDHLGSLKTLKNRHIQQKKTKVQRMVGIHFASAYAMPLTDILGPAGSAGRNAIKSTLKIGNSVGSMVRRYQGDQYQKKTGHFHTVLDTYQLYKQLYLQAGSDSPRREVITQLAGQSFGLKPDEFDTLTKTSLIESKQLKLSLSKP